MIFRCATKKMVASFDNGSEKAVDLHVRAQHFRHTPWTRGDPNKGEHSKSKDKENCVCPHSYKVTENR